MAIDYNSIIQNATNAYNTTVAGYKSQLAQQQAQQQGIIQGYNNLQAGVLGGLEQQSAVAGKLLSDQYAKQGADQQMQLFRQGLGNSTTRNNLQNQLNQSSALAQTNRIGNFAQQAADKQTQLGLAGLGYAGSALQNNLQFAGQGLQYAGQGSLGVANLAQGFAGLENQKAMQDAQFAQQIKMQRLNQLYGTGGGGGTPGSFDRPNGQGNAVRDSATPYGYHGGGDNPYYDPYAQKNIAVNQPALGSEIGANGEGYLAGGSGWQPYTGNEDFTGYDWGGSTINNNQVAWGQGDWSPYGYQGEDTSA